MRFRTAACAVVASGTGGWYISQQQAQKRMHARERFDALTAGPQTYRRVGQIEGWGKTVPIQCEDGGWIELWSPPKREDQLQRLEEEEFDVLVIGGGATGSGIALDAATRGLKVACVERDDFAAGTSSRSTKLIHGGIRYLLLTFQTKMPQRFSDLFTNLTFNQANYDVVKNDLYERAYMIESAPFMTKPLPMMIPMYKWWEVPTLWLGGKMYDAIAGSRRTVPASSFMSKGEAVYNFPSLRETDAEGRSLKGCLVLYDGQMNDTRMNLCIALTASQYGATIANHTTVNRLTSVGQPGEKGYRVTGAEVEDQVTGKKITIRAKQTVNATGPFTDAIRKMADPKAQDIIVPAQGAHLVLPDYLSPDSMGFVRMSSDGRVLYFLPWEGSTIAGTTDHRTDVTDKPKATEDEVDFIIREANAVLKRPVSRDAIRSSWAGLRPLVRDPNAKDTKSLARDHVIDVVDGGLISVCGGKWTTYRRMAEDGVNKVLELNPPLQNKASACATLEMQLLGADRSGLVCSGDFQNVVITLREKFALAKDVAHHLVSNYGTRALQVAAIAQSLESTRKGTSPADEAMDYRRLYSKYPLLEAEVLFACRNEYALSVVDVIARRTRLAFLDAEAAALCIPRIAQLMSSELQWPADETERQKANAYSFLNTMNTGLKPEKTQPPAPQAAEPTSA